MGKSLKGKELGKGITQRKDGTYMGRFVDRYGKTRYVYDKTYNHLCKKLRDAQYEDDKALNVGTSDMTLDEWFDIWIKEFKTDCRDTTKKNYIRNYSYVRDEIGKIKLQKLNTILIQKTLNKIDAVTVKREVRAILSDMLNQAVYADVIGKNPASKTKPVPYKTSARRVMTKEEEKIFCEFTKKSIHYNMYRIALETGMRAGELCGLMWSDVDLDNKIVHVRHNLVYLREDDKSSECRIHDPKTENGERLIPLTNTAVLYFHAQKEALKGRDPVKGFGDLVFRSRSNKPLRPCCMSHNLIVACQSIQKAYPDFEHVTMHTLRHTFATRAIENGIRPKSLQKIMGHSTLSITMDLYCHATDESLFEEMKKMEK